MSFRTSIAIHHVIDWSVEEATRPSTSGRSFYKVTKIIIQQKDQEGNTATTELNMFGPVPNSESN